MAPASAEAEAEVEGPEEEEGGAGVDEAAVEASISPPPREASRPVGLGFRRLIRPRALASLGVGGREEEEVKLNWWIDPAAIREAGEPSRQRRERGRGGGGQREEHGAGGAH